MLDQAVTLVDARIVPTVANEDPGEQRDDAERPKCGRQQPDLLRMTQCRGVQRPQSEEIAAKNADEDIIQTQAKRSLANIILSPDSRLAVCIQNQTLCQQF